MRTHLLRSTFTMSKLLKFVATVSITAIAAEGIYAALKVTEKLQNGTEETLQDAINTTIIEEKAKFGWWKRVASATINVAQHNLTQPQKVVDEYRKSEQSFGTYIVTKSALEDAKDFLKAYSKVFEKLF